MKYKPMIDQYLNSVEFKKKMSIPNESHVNYQFLAQGEYNLNLLFSHPVTSIKYVLRLNYGSQMHLTNQITYEYQALKLLESSRRTPKAYFVDESKTYLDKDALVMDYLEGVPLDYQRDIPLAMECLVDIHSLPVPKNHSLVRPNDPVQSILTECREMFSHYETSPLADERKVIQITRMLRYIKSRVNCLSYFGDEYRCITNTELNNTNFLINGRGKHNYIIDWEKPLYSFPAQDLGHFFAPTTTFWKTDIILTPEVIEKSLDYYIELVCGRFPTQILKEEVATYIPVTCMRGITWCAMAWIQYQMAQKDLTNASTVAKLEQYISQDFLDNIENNYLK